MPFTGTIQKRKTAFYDDFTSDENDAYWSWDMNLSKPVIAKKDEILTMTASGEKRCFWGINPVTGSYAMDVFVKNEGRNLKGLCVYGNQSNILALGVENSTLNVYIYKSSEKTGFFSLPITGSHIGLRIESVNARTFRFYWTSDKNDWQLIFDSSGNLNADFIPQWGKGVRAGLFVEPCGNDKTGFFSAFGMNYN